MKTNTHLLESQADNSLVAWILDRGAFANEAMNLLIRRHSEKLMARAKRLLPNEADRESCEDMVVTTFGKAWKNLPSYDAEMECAYPWLKRILENTIRDEWRKWGNRRHHLYEDSAYVEDERAGTDPMGELLAEEGFHQVRDLVQDVIETTAQPERRPFLEDVLELHWIRQSMSIPELAVKHAMTVDAAHMQHYRFRSKCRETISAVLREELVTVG